MQLIFLNAIKLSRFKALFFIKILNINEKFFYIYYAQH